MNRRTALCGALAMVVLVSLGAAAVGRTWTDDSGEYHVDGEFVSMAGGLVTLKTDDGRTVKIPLEKLSKADQEFVGKLKKTAPKENPFVEVPKAGGNERQEDPVKKTQQYVTDFLKRLSDQIDAVAAMDTQEKRNSAHEQLVKSLSAEVKQKSLTFRFTIADNVTNPDGRSSTLTLTDPEGAEGFTRVLSGITLAIHKADAAKINSGDILILSGKGNLSVTEYQTNRPFTYWSQVSRHEYAIDLSEQKFHVDHKK